MQEELGQQIRVLRLKKKLSLKECSERTGLSVGFLSMVERGMTSLAIVSLKKIADALESDVSDFFIKTEAKMKNGKTHLINRNYEQTISYQSGKYIYFTLNNNDPKWILDPKLIVLLPGQKREDVELFVHSGEEFVYVLDGILTLFFDGQEYELYPGDSFIGPCDSPHNFVNFTNNIVKVLFVLTPQFTYKDKGSSPNCGK